MKVKKLLALVVASAMMLGLFTVNVSAGIINANSHEDEHYSVNLYEVLGANALKAAQIRFNIKMVAGPEQWGWGGAIVVYNADGDDEFETMMEYDADGGKGKATISVSSSRVEYREKQPFFTTDDLSVLNDAGVPELIVVLAVWGRQEGNWGADVEVIDYVINDADGNALSFLAWDADGDEADEADADEPDSEEEPADEEPADEEPADEPAEEEPAEAAPAPVVAVSPVTNWPDFKVSSDFIAANPGAIGAPPIADSSNPAPAWWAWIFRK